MGTDMTLYVELYGSENFGERSKEIFEKVNSIGLTPSEYPIKILRAPVIRWSNDFTILNYYIYKFNAEECRETFLEESDLVELLDICNSILEYPEKAEALLPSGNSKYDDSYWDGVRLTQSTLNKVLSIPQFNDCDYYFRFC